MKNKKLLLLFGFAALSLNAAPEVPKNVPKAGDILRSVDPDKLLEQRGESYKAPQNPLLEPQDIKKPSATPDDKAKVFIKSFKFSHNSAISSDKLLSLIKKFENQELNLFQMQELTSIITKYYREKGFFVARAYVPAQELENDILEIAIIEGKLGEFKLKNDSKVKDEVALGYLKKIKSGDYVVDKHLERQLLLIDSLSGARVINSDVFPGENLGESDFLISLDETPKYSGYAMIDNYGTRYTGEHRLSLGANINNLTKIGDTLSLSALASQNANLQNYGVTYVRHLGYSGLSGGVGVSRTSYEMEETGKMDGVEVFGNSLNLNMFLSYPFIKTHTTSRTLDISTTTSKMEDDSGLSGYTQTEEKLDNTLTIKLSERRPTNLFSLPGNLTAYLGYALGNLSMENDEAKTSDEFIESEGFYHKLIAFVGHQQYLASKLTLQSSLKMQQNLGRNLDGGQKLSVAGSNGVRAYEDSELSGDSGFTASLDLIYSLPNFGRYFHNISLFTDYAKITKRVTDPVNDDKNDRTLAAYGVGYAFSYRNFSFKSTYGFGYGSEKTPTTEDEFSTKAQKFLFQAIYQF